MKMEKIYKQAKELLLYYPLCNRCLGRQFVELFEKEPEEIGREIKRKLNIKLEECHICENRLFNCADDFIKKIDEKTKSLEFNSFLVGSYFPKEILNREEEVWSINGFEYAQSIRGEINAELGNRLKRIWKKEIEYEAPDITILLDFIKNDVLINIAPIYIYGRYLKLSRELPQSKWICRCGKGCEKCRWTGKIYADTVEEIIGRKLLEITNGKNTKFHGCGREDIDAMMLGNGRPFIIEILEPKKRKINLHNFTKNFNKIEEHRVKLLDLCFVRNKDVEVLKVVRLDKTYRVVAEAERDIEKKDVRKINKLNVMIKQRTPTRVAQRRADKERRRKIKEISMELIDKRRFELIIRAQAGTYIKEFINGDEGRTKPSVAEKLGCNVRCIELDVLQIHDEFLRDLIFQKNLLCESLA